MTILLFLSLILFQTCTEQAEKVPEEDLTGVPQLKFNTILAGYEIIWGMDFLPNGDLLFTEKRGKIYRKSNATVTEVTGFPTVLTGGQGGLLDIKAHPNYSSNGWVYASYAATNPGGGGQLKLVRFKIAGDRVSEVQDLFSTTGSNFWFGHYGSRIDFDRENYLYLSVGEGGIRSYGGPTTNNNNAQNPASPWGKIHRMNDDGSVPASNPVFTGITAPTSVYSYGHRNPQGLIMHPVRNELWSTEHGPMGGDEVNIITKGVNYGWPAYSLGLNYDGSTISSGHTAVGITEPIYTWTPSIGISGMALITSSTFKSWKGNLLVGGLASEKLYRCVVDGNRITSEEVMLTDYGRVRDVIQAPDGSIYVSVENPGRLIQIIAE